MPESNLGERGLSPARTVSGILEMNVVEAADWKLSKVSKGSNESIELSGAVKANVHA